jgi:serine/threonine protein phosphatase PrpC
MTNNEETKPINFKFHFDKIEGKGHDAEPTCIVNDFNSIIAVYDGMGSASVEYDFNDQTKASAFWASFFTKQETESLFYNNFELEFFVPNLESHLRSFLKEMANKLEKTPTKFKGNLANRRLPTTIAGMLYNSTDRKVTSFWAGDSRCYILKKDGLIQVSKDDVVTNSDALGNLLNDAPMSNFINADIDFTINSTTNEFSMPFFMLTATDGCFSYLESPAHFEYLLLENLYFSYTVEEWKANIVRQLQEVASDDISMSICSVGYNEFDFERIKTDFILRFDILKNSYILPIDELTNEIEQYEISIKRNKEKIEKCKNKRNQLRLELWEDYKKNYEI